MRPPTADLGTARSSVLGVLLWVSGLDVVQGEASSLQRIAAVPVRVPQIVALAGG